MNFRGDEKFHVEQFQNLNVGFKVEGAQEIRQWHFSGTVDTHRNRAGRIGFEFNPRAAIGNDGCVEDIFARHIDSLVIVTAGASDQL